jgi:hypothetical protein
VSTATSRHVRKRLAHLGLTESGIAFCADAIKTRLNTLDELDEAFGEYRANGEEHQYLTPAAVDPAA